MKTNIITAGVDEVGRGCLAGPVVSAAVILKKSVNLSLLKDSKKITFKKRIEIAKHIRLNSICAVGMASVEEILKINILQAALLSMKRAIDQLSIKPELVLIDGNFAPQGMSLICWISEKLGHSEKFLSTAAHHYSTINIEKKDEPKDETPDEPKDEIKSIKNIKMTLNEKYEFIERLIKRGYTSYSQFQTKGVTTYMLSKYKKSKGITGEIR